jgi:L-lactate dehydrogenase complex protein LldG
MSSDQIRNAILDTVQKNQPASLPMPHIPHFGIEDAYDMVESFTQGVLKMAGTVVPDAISDLDDFVRSRFPNAEVICSAVPECKALFGLLNLAIGRKRARST